MKRLNLKLVVSLVVGMLVMVAGVWIVHGMQQRGTSAELKLDADKLAQDGKDEEALKKYLAYLKQNPDDVQIHLVASKLAIKITDDVFKRPVIDGQLFWAKVGQAVEEINRSVRGGNRDNSEFHEIAAEFLMRYAALDRSGKMFTDARSHLEWLTSPLRRKSHLVKFDLDLAKCYAAQDKLDEAMKIYAGETGFDLQTFTFTGKGTAPKEVDAYVAIAGYLRGKLDRKRPKEADAVMEKLVSVNGDSFKAHLARSKYLFIFQAAEDEKTRTEWKAIAQSELAAAQKLAPEDPDVILFAAQVATEFDNDHEKAEKLLAHGLALSPKNVDMYRLSAEVKKSQNNLDGAARTIEQGLKQLPDSPVLLESLVDVKLRQRDVAGANAIIKKLAETKYNETRLDFLRAMVLLTEDKWLQGVRLLEQLKPRLEANSPESRRCTLLIARCYEKLGEPDKQIEASRNALASDKTNLDGMIEEASALARLGKPDEAAAEFERIGQKMFKERGQITPQVWLQMFEGRIRQQLKKPVSERDWGRVDALTKYLEQTAPDDVSTAVAKAEVAYDKGNSKQAVETLEKCLAANAKDVRVWSALVRTILRQRDGGPDAALKRLEKAPPEVRENVIIRLVQAEALMHLGTDKLKASLSQLEAGSDKMSASERLQLWSGLGLSLAQVGDREGAIRYWTKVADADPGDINIRINGLLDAAREDANEPVLDRVLVDVERLTNSKTSVESLYVQAAKKVALLWKSIRDRTKRGGQADVLESDEKEQLAAARDLLNQVSQARPGWYQVTKILGDLDVIDGNEEGAIEKYEKALETGPPSPGTIRSLALLLSRHNRTEELNKFIAGINEQFGPDTLSAVGIPRVEAESLVKAAISDEAAGKHADATKKFDEAVAKAKAEVPDGSLDPLNHLWIARIYDQANKPELAEASYRRAVKTGPTLPDTWLLLVANLIEHKKMGEAQTVLMDARKQLPEDKVNQVLGTGYEALGENALAEQYYRAALDSAPHDLATHRYAAMYFMRTNRMDEAKKEVATVLRGAKGDPKNRAHLIWARRALAEILAATGSREDFIKAKALLIENTKIDKPEVEDQIRVANLLAHRFNESAMLRESLEWYGKVPAADLSPEDRINIAKLHEVLGDWHIARQEMLDLVAKAKSGPAAYLAFIDMLVRNGQFSDAETYLDKLNSLSPGAGLLQRMRLLVKQGKNGDAIALLRYIVPKKPVPKEKQNSVIQAAIVSDEVGLNEKAEELYREYMEYQPSLGALQLAGFLGRDGRIDEALELLEPRITERGLKPEDRQIVLQALSDVLHGKPNRIQPRHLERVKGWFDQLLREDPESASLILQYADFLLVVGQDERAEKLYRDVLARSDLNAVQRGIAANDLAFVLATQQRSLPEALDLVNRAGADLGFTSDILDTRGMVYLAMKKYREAVADFSDAVLVINPAPSKLLHLAWAQSQIPDRSAATQSLRKAIKAKLDVLALTKVEKGFYERLMKDIGP